VSYNDKEAKLLKKEALSGGSATVITTLSDPIAATVAWSPSSEKILYQDSKNETYTIWSDGTRRAVLSDGDSYDASWSPDGTQIAFTEDPGDSSISIREADGTVVQIPIEKGQYTTVTDPTWSPDGTKVLVTMSRGTKKDRDVFMVDIGGGTATPTKIIDNSGGKVSWQVRR
jgi:Tol biopolymer transport system component